jgi:DNA-binding SARP family transcriptional activator
MAEPPARVRFAVLGPVVVRTAGRVLAPGSAVRRALLGLLLLADGQPLPPDRLLRAVWGDEPPDTGRGAVHVAVSRLRSWLDRNLGGAAELAHEAGGYRLRAPAASLDAAAFRALVAASVRAASPEAQIRRLCDALALWRGPVVADATAWLGTDVLVRRIEGLRVEAACALADAAVAARQPEQAVSWLEAAAGDNPLDERAAPGRYRLHPLVRLFARERARADGLDPAGQDGGVVSTTTWMPSRPVSSRRSR